MNIEELIIEAFWDGVDDKATWEDLNRGVEVIFNFGGKEYSINTGIKSNYGRFCMSFESYQNMIEMRAINEVLNEELLNEFISKTS